MHRLRFSAVVVSAIVLFTHPGVSWADRPAPPMAMEKLAMSEAVVIGKVTSLEEKLLDAKPVPGAEQKVGYQIAVVKISEGIGGAKGLTHIKVGYIPEQGRPSPRRYPRVNLAEGDEVILYVTPHHEGAFHVVPDYYCVTNRKDPNYAPELEAVKKAAKLLEDPVASLKSKNADERFMTAALLVCRYRNFRTNQGGKTEPIDAEQSRLILEALAAADWSKEKPELGNLNAQTVFFRLGVTAKDGWTQPTDFKDTETSAKQWLKDHAASYKIQRLLPGDEKK
jgi:hypothetical protein